MKKILLFIIGVLFILTPKIVFADGINDYYINATILDNGDLEVEEYFDLDSRYNGMERIIKYRNSNSVEFNAYDTSYGGSSIHNGNNMMIEEIKSVSINHDFNFNNFDGKLFKKVEYASIGDYGVYTENIIDGGLSTKIFMPSSKKKAFYIKYILNNMAVLHDDVGELGWSIFDTALNESIKNLRVYVSVPNNKDIIKVWAHGPENGKSNIISNEKVEATINNLNSNTAIDIRVVFDKSVIKNSNKTTNVSALDKIINYETELANISNKKREDYLESKFYTLKSVPSMNNYIAVLNTINEYNNEEKTEYYLNRLYEYKDKVDVYEYNNFKSEIQKQTYYGYEITSCSSDKVFNTELKNKITEERNNLKNKLIKTEILNEIKTIILAMLSILLSYLIISIPKFKNRKIKKVVPIYTRDLPKDISIVSAGILIDSKLSKDEISGAILDLIRKKIIILDYTDQKHPILILNKDNYNVAFDTDRYLVNLIFEHNNQVELKKIKKINTDRFKNWKNLLLKELKDKGYAIETDDEKPIKINVIFVVSSIISFFTPFYILGIFFLLIYSLKRYKQYTIIVIFQIINYILLRNTLLNNHFIYLSIITNILAIIMLFLYLRKITFKLNIKLTNLGLEKRKELFGLRNFLNDFSRLNEKDIPEVYLWEEYLIYATVFGIGDKVLNSMKLKDINNSIIDNVSFVYNYSNYIDSFSNISNNILFMTKPEMKLYMPESLDAGTWGGSSSGSGGGGGFSGGSSSGGSFGGGGGGGRF